MESKKANFMRFVLYNNLFKIIWKLLEIFDRSIPDKYLTEIFNINNMAQSYVNIRDKYMVQIFGTNILDNEIEATDSSGILAD